MVGAWLLMQRHLMQDNQIQCSKITTFQNSIARFLMGTKRTEHITPVLAQLHWLKIAQLIEYKVALLTFNALTTHQPAYLYDQQQLCGPTRQIRSSDKINRLQLNSSKTVFAINHAFRNATPLVWNGLPHHLTNDLSSLASFRHNLKTHLFTKSFRHWLPWPVCNGGSSIDFDRHVASSTV